MWAPDLDGLFAEAAHGLIAVMGSPQGPVERREHIVVEADDLEALLVDWLSEVLFWFEARDLVPLEVAVRIEGDGPCRLEADVGGAASFVEEGPGVKAVTFHGLDLTEDAEGWQGRVYLDV